MKHCLLLIALLATCAVNNAQTTDFIYLMPSQEIAETGKVLWFKAYLMDGRTLTPSDRSKTLFLQVRSEADSIVWSEQYLLEGGRGDGHVYIGKDWPLGEYYLEGYAQSSFASDSAQTIRPRRIRVVDRITQMDSVSSQAAKNDSIQRIAGGHRFDLFPEGGNLIYGVNSVVAFKATYGNGFPEEVTGKVFENGHKIASIKTLHDGMGMFAVKPRAGKEYRVELSDGRTFPFPKIESRGMAMKVLRNNSKGVTIIVSASDSVAHSFAITAKLHGVVCCKATGKVKKQQMVVLPLKYFANQGIAELTLENESGFPVAERLVYVNPDQLLDIVASDIREHYGRRKMDTLSLQVTDAEGKPVNAELAVSIFDKAYLYQPGHENILSHCYLSEQIRGSIFNPTYYFDKQNDDRLQSLDLLLLTQGWRRYVWNTEPKQCPPLIADVVSGKLIAKREIGNATQIIKAFSPQGDTCVILTDSSGSFVIEQQLKANMPGRIYLTPFLTDRYKASLSIVNPFDTINEYRHNLTRYIVNNQFVKTDNGSRVIIDDENVVHLDEVVVTDKRGYIYRDKEIDFLDSLAVLLSGEWVCDCDTVMPYLNDYKGYSHHPRWSPQEAHYCGKRLVPKRGEKYQLIEIKESCVQPDSRGEFPIFCMSIQSDPTKPGRARSSSRPEFFIWKPTDEPRRNFIYPGPQYDEEEVLQMYGISRVQSYYPHREFYEPDSIALATSLHDSRSLLLWKPAVVTDANGVVKIPFSTSDVNTEFIGIVEAIDGKGLMGCQTFSFKVLKY